MIGIVKIMENIEMINLVCLLIVSGRNALVEDLSLGRVDVLVDPTGPRGEGPGKSLKTVHILGYGGTILNKVPTLGFTCVKPPMPRIENKHVHSSPCVAFFNGV